MGTPPPSLHMWTGAWGQAGQAEGPHPQVQSWPILLSAKGQLELTSASQLSRCTGFE